MIVILNPNAGGGSARAKWDRVEPRLREHLGPFELVVAANAAAVRLVVAHAIRTGETEFIAAGGDGTVNLVLNTILASAPRGLVGKIKLGAIGLGSSNDFHKPLSRERMIDGIPFKLDFVSTVRHDVGLLTYRDAENNLRTRRWLINVSVGTTAEANSFFNSPSRLLRFLKRYSPGRGMVYAALRTLVGYRPYKMAITVDDNETVHTRVRNLGIVKNPHFTGALRYDSPYEPGGGHFYVHLLRNLPFPRVVLALARLAFGKFNGQKGTQSWRARRVRIEAEAGRPFVVEGDGEVVTASRAYFSMVPELIQVCT
jgi:diacylglycerol kinase family enzyme